MPYLIDGYNLLFSFYDVDGNFSNIRNLLIRSLNEQIQRLKIDVILVFDAQYCPGLSKKTHFNHLEILFSGEGETADDLIIKTLEMTSTPCIFTVVTSDNRLAWRARGLGAKTESSRNFYLRLNKADRESFDKRIEGSSLKKIKKETLPATPYKPKKVKKPGLKATPQECFDYYLYIFDRKVKEIKPKKKQKLSEMERWEKIFEERFRNESNGA